MTKKFLANVGVILATLSLAVGFSACITSGGIGGGSSVTSSDQTQTGQVPVYQGMTISGAATTAKVNPRNRSIMKAPGNTDNNGKHNGWYKGDYDEDEDVDQEDPYPDNNENENIENEIKTSLDVIGADQEIYYTTKNQDIYINVHLSNPENYEIISFTLNGKKYSSYMFEDGSNMETLILKYNVGDNSGVQEYTIDAIKYIDGTVIKDVLMDGDKTVTAGIKTDNQVVATITDMVVGTNSICYDVDIQDNDNLISYSEGCLKAVLYDGDTLVATQDLVVGQNSVAFYGLSTHALYQYAIVGYYDDFSGVGFDMNVLYKNALYTKAVVLFDNIVIGQEYVQFTLLWEESIKNKTLTSLTLCHNESRKELSSVSTVVDALLSNTEYTLIAEYKNGEATESIYLNFATATKATPVVEITNASKTQTSVSFEINETDTDNVGKVTKIELVHANGTIIADNADVREFTNLLSNNAYTVKVTYVYDLNDGTGEHEIIKTLDIQTLAKATPTVKIISATKTQTSVSFEINETDMDNVGEVTKIELVHANGTIIADNADVREFTNLLSNNAYTVKVTYVYDLNDGTGEHEIIKTLDIQTLAKAMPVVEIINASKTQTSVSFEINETDIDNVGEVAKIELVHDTDGVIIADTLNQTKFENLTNLLNNSCTLCVSYEYDLKDGLGIQKVVIEEEFAAGSFGLEYQQSGNGFSVIGRGSCQDQTIIIPATYKSKPVVFIANNAFLKDTDLVGVIMPDSIVSIDSYAFSECGNLQSVDMSNGVRLISNYAFDRCSSLMEINFPNGIKQIGAYAFYKCVSMTSIVIPSSVTSIGLYAFRGCSSLTDIIIQDGVTTINPYTFAECVNLTSIVIPDSVTSIGAGAFSGCSSLTSVVIPDSVTVMNECAFYKCTNLNNVVIGDSVTTIGRYAFEYCSNLTSVIIPKSVITIGERAFVGPKMVIYSEAPSKHPGWEQGWNSSGSSYRPVYWYSENKPENDGQYWHYVDGEIVTWECHSGTEGVVYCISSDYTYVTVGSYTGTDTDVIIASTYQGITVTGIEASAFSGCSSLTSIVIPDSVTSIGEYAFRNCSSLTSIVIPDSVTTIGYQAFSGCSSLTSIVIPDSVTSIGAGAFSRCSSLEEITLPFVGATKEGTSNKHFGYIFGASSYSYNDDYVPASLKKVTITGGSIGHYAFFGCSSLTSMVIGDSVTTIGYQAFSGCSSLTSIVIPDSVTTIGYQAFFGCSSLTSIVIPDSVTSIGAGAFMNCTNLADVVIPNGITSIGQSMFANCRKLTSIVIPYGVTSIGQYAFSGCIGLTTVVIPDSVTTINSSAFSGCISLMSVYYKGTANDWANITIDSSNSYLTVATCYYYSDSQPTEEGNFWYYNEDGEIIVWQ